jgi:SAM-dependent methyltransferase
MQAIGRPGRAAPARVLVAGCGAGVEAFLLRRRLPAAEIVAVDFSPRSIVVARRLQGRARSARPINFLVADLTDPQLARRTGGAFDLITCHGVLSYIPEPGRALRSLGACLAPDGAMYLGVNGEATPSVRLRPWLAGFGLAIDELKDERRLRQLLRLWDSLHEDELGALAAMSTSYLAGDVCGVHFNNWPLARWRAEANRCGWELAGTDILPTALLLTMAQDNYLPLYPGGGGEVAAQLDQVRPAGFHRMMLRRAEAGELDLRLDGRDEPRLRWTGLFSVRFRATAGRRKVIAAFRCATFNLRLDQTLTQPQAEALRDLATSGVSSPGGMKPWTRTAAGRRSLWLWAGLGAVAVDAGS